MLLAIRDKREMPFHQAICKNTTAFTYRATQKSPVIKELVQFTSAQMVFRFRTDHSSNRPGFHIKARQVQCGSRVPPVTNLGKAPALGVPCTYEFCDRSGVFYSQGFPGPYPNQMSCTYRVLALPGHCRVELSFVQFNLESHKKPDGQCGADFMEINNVRYCNRQLEGQIRILDFKDSPRSITMHFITNDHNAGRGFLGFYKQLACEGHNRLPPGVPDRPVPAEPPSLFAPGFEPPRQPPDTQRQPSCDRLYALREFELESPGYPSSYPPGLDCRYFIRRLNDGICALRVTFNSFDLEDSPSCHNDYFEVDGHKICGQLPPGKAKEVPLRDFQTTFRFHSNGAVEHRGFLVQVVQVPCQGPPSFDAQPSPPGRYPHHSAMGPAGHTHPHPHPGKKPPKRLSKPCERLKGQPC
ncbi:cubilin-like [Ixodes scapularis]|uniref:cubilin-like n=1 Tax=Ixodes scapularis TaxID=6945 RepID=UPI001A9E7C3A|nr:cubilin-like [Ixodes scapularis]